MSARLSFLLLCVCAFTPPPAAAQATRGVPGAFGRLGLPPALVRVAAGTEATARRLLGAPDSVGQVLTTDDARTRGLLYRRVGGYRVTVVICTAHVHDSPGCVGKLSDRPVYQVYAVRAFADEPARLRFDAYAGDQLEAVSRNRWVESDQPNYDLPGGATATVEPMSGPNAMITLFRTPSPAVHPSH
jgi:hypothetical protein